MAESGLENTFEQDTKSFINQINEGLIELENNGYSKDVINHIFRCVHSIKSEAAYLEYKEIADEAHKIESAIEPLRNVGTEVEVDPDLITFCFDIMDNIVNLTGYKPPADDEAELLELLPADEDEDEPEEVLSEEQGPYTEFELNLIEEARLRREKMFRVSFTVSMDETMKYARVYLAVSNLEQKMNVIKITPELEDLKDADNPEITIILTSRYSETGIAKELNIDQIDNIEITLLKIEEELKNLPQEQPEKELPAQVIRDRVINVEADEIDALSNYVTEIKKRLADLSSGYKDNNDLAGLENISESIEKMMNNLKTVDFNAHFAGFKRTARDIAAKTAKKAELVFDENNGRIERDFADYIAEPMLQIIRNAVVHGIEFPRDRVSAGKNEIGKILVTLRREDTDLEIEIADDGAGLDDLVTMDGGSPAELLNKITKPGFTTHPLSAEFAGRGVGLDLVLNKVEQRNGFMELENRKGKGCTFSLVFKNREEFEKVLVVEYEGKTFALRSRSEIKIRTIEVKDIKKKDNFLYYDDFLLLSCNGPLSNIASSDTVSFQAAHLSVEGKEAYLVFSDSLFEVSHDRSSLSEEPTEDPYFNKFIIENEPADYPVLSVKKLFETV